MFRKAIMKRNIADAEVLIMLPAALIESKRVVTAAAASATATGIMQTTAESPSEKADSGWSLTLVYQFSCDVIDGGNMVRVNCMPQTKGIGE